MAEVLRYGADGSNPTTPCGVPKNIVVSAAPKRVDLNQKIRGRWRE
jgi:hypothetical protein